jgi:hypothetical protein
MESTPGEEPRAANERLHRQHEDALWDRAAGNRARMPLEVLSGDVGPKGTVGWRMRMISAKRARIGEQVPVGGAPGTGALILALVATVVIVAGAVLGLLVWLVS